MNTTTTIPVANDTGKLNDLLNCLHEFKDSSIVEAEDHVRDTCNLCKTIKALMSNVYRDIEYLEKDIKEAAKQPIILGNMGRWIDSIREYLYQTETLLGLIEERIEPFTEVDNIFYYYGELMKG